MARNPSTSVLYGAVAGTLVAIGFVAFFGAYTAIETVEAVPIGTTSVAVEAMFTATAGGFFMLVGTLSVAGGIVIAVAAYAAARVLDPDSGLFALWYMIPIGMLIGGTLGFATVSLGISLTGDISAEGVVTVSVASLVIVAAIAGALAGGATAPVVDLLAHPATLGPRNEATPSSSKAFWSDLMGAVGVPVLTIIVVAAMAIGLSQVLLNSHSTATAVAIFSVTGAIILGITTLIALRPWDRTTPQS